MSALRIRTVDAFADGAFTGNPVGVLVLDAFPPDGWMQSFAAELNLSETAFVVPEDTTDGAYQLRWFTPVTEVDLCGRATLAAAHCLFRDGAAGPLRFMTRSGVLTVGRVGAMLTMNFPAGPPLPIDVPDGLAAALGTEPVWTGRGGTNDVLCELADEAAVRGLVPDIDSLRGVEVVGDRVVKSGRAVLIVDGVLSDEATQAIG